MESSHEVKRQELTINSVAFVSRRSTDRASNFCKDCRTVPFSLKSHGYKLLEDLGMNLKEARGSFFGLRVEVLKLQSRIQDKLRSPSYYIIISTYDQS